MTIKPSLPIVYVLWLIVTILLAIFFLLNNATFLFSFINTLVISAILYYFFVNKACLLSIEDNILIVKYLFPMRGTKHINLAKVSNIKFEFGYYYFFNEDSKTAFLYLLHPYDIMIVSFKDEDQKTNILFNSNLLKTLKISKALKRRFGGSVKHENNTFGK